MKWHFTRAFIAVALCTAIVTTPGGSLYALPEAGDFFAVPSNLPQFQLQPPARLGRVSDYFNAPTAEPSPSAVRFASGSTLSLSRERVKHLSLLPAEGEGARRADEGREPLVILIQDLHAHYGVQKNIAGLLDFLASRLSSTLVGEDERSSGGGPLSFTASPHPNLPPQRGEGAPFAIAVEGASGPVDSSIMALYPNTKAKLAAADYLMREGELTGAEYFAIARGLPHALTGAENETYYHVNRELFRKTLDERQDLVDKLHRIQNDIEPLARPVLRENGALWNFQKEIYDYEKGKMGADEYIGLLWRMASANETSLALKKEFPTLALFAANAQFGTMEEVRAETSQFLTQVQSRLSAEEKANLKILAKHQDTTPYYLYLRELVFAKGLFLAVPSELGQFMEYTHTVQTLGMDQVLHEAKELSFKLQLDLAHRGGSTQAADFIQVHHDLDLLLRVADLQAGEYEVRDFAPRLNQFLALTKTLLKTVLIAKSSSPASKSSSPADAGGGSTASSTFLDSPPVTAGNDEKSKTAADDDNMRRLISSSIDFYVMALMRNQPMIDNTLALIGERDLTPQTQHVKLHKFLRSKVLDVRSEVRDQPSVAVLVAGGFHTAQLTSVLRAKNVSYVVITPSVDRITDHDRALYIQRLRGDHLTAEAVRNAAITKTASWVEAVKRVGGPKLHVGPARWSNVIDFWPAKNTLSAGVGELPKPIIDEALVDASALIAGQAVRRGDETAESEAPRKQKRISLLTLLRTLSRPWVLVPSLGLFGSVLSHAQDLVINFKENIITGTITGNSHGAHNTLGQVSLQMQKFLGIKPLGAHHHFSWKQIQEFARGIKLNGQTYTGQTYHKGDVFSREILKGTNPQAVIDRVHAAHEHVSIIQAPTHPVPHLDIPGYQKPELNLPDMTHWDQVQAWVYHHAVTLEILGGFLIAAIIVWVLYRYVWPKWVNRRVESMPLDEAMQAVHAARSNPKALKAAARRLQSAIDAAEKTVTPAADAFPKLPEMYAKASAAVFARSSKPLGKALPLGTSAPANGNSGARRRMRVTTRVADAGDDALIYTALKAREHEFETSIDQKNPPAVETFEFAGRTFTHYLIYATLGPSEGAYWFHPAGLDHPMIVVNRALDENVQKEALFRDQIEMALAQIDPSALTVSERHIITSYLSVPQEFMNEQTGLSGLLMAGLDAKSPEELAALLSEYSRGRAAHYQLIDDKAKAFGITRAQAEMQDERFAMYAFSRMGDRAQDLRRQIEIIKLAQAKAELALAQAELAHRSRRRRAVAALHIRNLPDRAALENAIAQTADQRIELESEVSKIDDLMERLSQNAAIDAPSLTENDAQAILAPAGQTPDSFSLDTYNFLRLPDAERATRFAQANAQLDAFEDELTAGMAFPSPQPVLVGRISDWLIQNQVLLYQNSELSQRAHELEETAIQEQENYVNELRARWQRRMAARQDRLQLDALTALSDFNDRLNTAANHQDILNLQSDLTGWATRNQSLLQSDADLSLLATTLAEEINAKDETLKAEFIERQSNLWKGASTATFLEPVTHLRETIGQKVGATTSAAESAIEAAASAAHRAQAVEKLEKAARGQGSSVEPIAMPATESDRQAAAQVAVHQAQVDAYFADQVRKWQTPAAALTPATFAIDVVGRAVEAALPGEEPAAFAVESARRAQAAEKLAIAARGQDPSTEAIAMPATEADRQMAATAYAHQQTQALQTKVGQLALPAASGRTFEITNPQIFQVAKQPIKQADIAPVQRQRRTPETLPSSGQVFEMPATESDREAAVRAAAYQAKVNEYFNDQIRQWQTPAPALTPATFAIDVVRRGVEAALPAVKPSIEETVSARRAQAAEKLAIAARGESPSTEATPMPATEADRQAAATAYADQQTQALQGKVKQLALPATSGRTFEVINPQILLGTKPTTAQAGVAPVQRPRRTPETLPSSGQVFEMPATQADRAAVAQAAAHQLQVDTYFADQVRQWQRPATALTPATFAIDVVGRAVVAALPAVEPAVTAVESARRAQALEKINRAARGQGSSVEAIAMPATESDREAAAQAAAYQTKVDAYFADQVRQWQNSAFALTPATFAIDVVGRGVEAALPTVEPIIEAGAIVRREEAIVKLASALQGKGSSPEAIAMPATEADRQAAATAYADQHVQELQTKAGQLALPAASGRSIEIVNPQILQNKQQATSEVIAPSVQRHRRTSEILPSSNQIFEMPATEADRITAARTAAEKEKMAAYTAERIREWQAPLTAAVTPATYAIEVIGRGIETAVPTLSPVVELAIAARRARAAEKLATAQMGKGPSSVAIAMPATEADQLATQATIEKARGEIEAQWNSLQRMTTGERSIATITEHQLDLTRWTIDNAALLSTNAELEREALRVRLALDLQMILTQAHDINWRSLTQAEVDAWKQQSRAIAQQCITGGLSADPVLDSLVKQSAVLALRKERMLPAIHTLNILLSSIDARADLESLRDGMNQLTSSESEFSKYEFDQKEAIQAEINQNRETLRSRAAVRIASNLDQWAVHIAQQSNIQEKANWESQKANYMAWAANMGIAQNPDIEKALRVYDAAIVTATLNANMAQTRAELLTALNQLQQKLEVNRENSSLEHWQKWQKELIHIKVSVYDKKLGSDPEIASVIERLQTWITTKLEALTRIPVLEDRSFTSDDSPAKIHPEPTQVVEIFGNDPKKSVRIWQEQGLFYLREYNQGFAEGPRLTVDPETGTRRSMGALLSNRAGFGPNHLKFWITKGESGEYMIRMEIKNGVTVRFVESLEYRAGKKRYENISERVNKELTSFRQEDITPLQTSYDDHKANFIGEYTISKNPREFRKGIENKLESLANQFHSLESLSETSAYEYENQIDDLVKQWADYVTRLNAAVARSIVIKSNQAGGANADRQKIMTEFQALLGQLQDIAMVETSRFLGDYGLELVTRESRLNTLTGEVERALGQFNESSSAKDIEAVLRPLQVKRDALYSGVPDGVTPVQRPMPASLRQDIRKLFTKLTVMEQIALFSENNHPALFVDDEVKRLREAIFDRRKELFKAVLEGMQQKSGDTDFETAEDIFFELRRDVFAFKARVALVAGLKPRQQDADAVTDHAVNQARSHLKIQPNDSWDVVEGKFRGAVLIPKPNLLKLEISNEAEFKSIVQDYAVLRLHHVKTTEQWPTLEMPIDHLTALSVVSPLLPKDDKLREAHASLVELLKRGLPQQHAPEFADAYHWALAQIISTYVDAVENGNWEVVKMFAKPGVKKVALQAVEDSIFGFQEIVVEQQIDRLITLAPMDDMLGNNVDQLNQEILRELKITQININRYDGDAKTQAEQERVIQLVNYAKALSTLELETVAKVRNRAMMDALMNGSLSSHASNNGNGAVQPLNGDHPKFVAKLPEMPNFGGVLGDILAEAEEVLTGGMELPYKWYRGPAVLWEYVRPLLAGIGLAATFHHLAQGSDALGIAVAAIVAGLLAKGLSLLLHRLFNPRALEFNPRGINALATDTAVMASLGTLAFGALLAGSPILLALAGAAWVIFSTDLLLKHYRLNYAGAYNRQDGARANQTTLETIWEWLAQHRIFRSHSYISFKMNGLHLVLVAVAEAAQSGTAQTDDAALNSLMPNNADVIQQRRALLDPINTAA